MSAVALWHISLKITELDPGSYNYDGNFCSFSYYAQANADFGTCNVVGTYRFLSLSILSFLFPDFKS